MYNNFNIFFSSLKNILTIKKFGSNMIQEKQN